MKAGKTVRWIQILGGSKSSIEGSKKSNDKRDEDDDEIKGVFKRIAEFAKNNNFSNYDGNVIESYSKTKSCLPSRFMEKFK